MNRVAECSNSRKKVSLREGQVFGKTYPDILLDTGAETSLVKKNILPPEHKKAGTVLIQVPGGQVIKKPVALVDVKLGERELTVRCGIVEDKFISTPLLLGHNLPGIGLENLLCETMPPQDKQQPEQQQQPEAQASSQDPQTQSGGGDPPESAAPAQVNRLQLVNVVHTRASRARQQKEDQDDDRATQQSQANITPWEEIETLPEEEIVDVPEESDPQDTVTPMDPQDRKEFAQK